MSAAEPTTSEAVNAEQSQLQAQLAEIQTQIAQYQKTLTSLAGQKNTLQNKLTHLQTQQAALKLEITSTSLIIDDLLARVAETTRDIDANVEKQTALRIQLTDILVAIQTTDNHSLFLSLLSRARFSDLYTDIEQLSALTTDLRSLLEQTKTLNAHLITQKADLVTRQEEADALLALQVLQKNEMLDSAREQATLLQQTKGKEQTYQATLKQSQAQAKTIQNRLYQLLDVQKQITFGEAVTIAKWASAQTGVRAAFLLSVLTQESNLGKNVGTCNRPKDPPEKSWRVVMKPTRDHKPFLEITSALGMNPDTTPISCPMRAADGSQIGWGGAMGPAQFIPSTWMGYASKVTAITGKPSNPWDIRDAFLASALKLGADGAKTVEGEWAAAMRYFSGSTNPAFRFYGDNVVARANQYQADIEALN